MILFATRPRPAAPPDAPFPLPPRIVVCGTTGSGKSTAARRLASLNGGAYIELDALHWEPNWTEAPTEVLRERVQAVIGQPAWVIDGNYEKLRDLTWTSAQLMIWLDYTIVRVFWQLTIRTFRRRFRNEVLWSGNRERLREFFFSRESLYWWALKTHWMNRKRRPQRLAEYPHLRCVRVRSPRELEGLLRAAARAD
jgi:adenylate kinase family enzyme